MYMITFQKQISALLIMFGKKFIHEYHISIIQCWKACFFFLALMTDSACMYSCRSIAHVQVPCNQWWDGGTEGVIVYSSVNRGDHLYDIDKK